MDHKLIFCCSIFAILVGLSLCSNSTQRRFEYKYSFKPPYLTKDDGTIPFWNFGGHAIASDDSIRITPSLKNKRGWLWTANATTFDNWEVEVAFRITGRGRIGADGIAIWFTDKPGVEGPVYGSSDKWNGLGIFLDSYDNDQQHNNPSVLAVLNDGQQEYDHNGDGSRQSLGMCVRDYRNKPSAVRVRIRLLRRRLFVWLTNGLSEKDHFEPCFETQDLAPTMSARGYFGISAATGGLADDHDVQYFLANSIVDLEAKATESAPQPDAAQTPAEAQAAAQAAAITDEERSKFEKEFEGFLEKLKAAKTDFDKDQGEADAKHPSDMFETEADRNVRQILAMQSDTLEAVRHIQEVLKALSLPTPVVSSPAPVVDNSATHEVRAALPDLARKNDVTHLQENFQSTLNSLRSVVDEVLRRVNSNNNPSAGYDPLAIAQTNTKKIDDLSHEMSGSFNSLRDEVHKLVRSNVQSQQAAQTCSCVSTTFTVLLVAVQLGLFVAFELYKKSRETQAKKFY